MTLGKVLDVFLDFICRPFSHRLHMLRKNPPPTERVTVSPVQLSHIDRYRQVEAVGDVLDVACGTGYGSAVMTGYKSYCGVDASEVAINYARDHYGHLGSFAFKDIMDVCLDYDTIVCFETLEHLEMPELELNNLVDHLRPGGRLWLSIPLNHPCKMDAHRWTFTEKDLDRLLNGHEYKVLDPGKWMGVIEG